MQVKKDSPDNTLQCKSLAVYIMCAATIIAAK